MLFGQKGSKRGSPKARMTGHQQDLQKYDEVRRIYKILIENKKIWYTEAEGKHMAELA
jgi:hypothetical protein